MKLNLTIIIVGIFSIFSCGQKSKLTRSEIDLLKRINFNTELISELKDLTNSELKQLPAIDQETGEVIKSKVFEGIYTETNEEKAIEFVKKLKSKFRENGFLIFVNEGDDYKKNVAVIKGTDDLDILRYRKTDGINYDIDNEKLVAKISEWKTKYGLIVIGCSRDWLQIEFDKMPTDLNTFANEVYEFCPDSVDQGVGSIEKLKEAIQEMKGVWLWWD